MHVPGTAAPVLPPPYGVLTPFVVRRDAAAAAVRGKAAARSAATAAAIAQAAPSPRQQQQQLQQPYYLTTASPGIAVTFSAGPGEEVTAAAAVVPSARPFDVLMDTFSLHEFMIRVGRAVTETPEYESYHRSYEPLWDVISVLVLQVGAEGLWEVWGGVEKCRV